MRPSASRREHGITLLIRETPASTNTSQKIASFSPATAGRNLAMTVET